MTSAAIQDQAKTYAKPRPEIRPGFTVRVHERIQEGGKERVQVFEGLVIAVHRGATETDTTLTVRRRASGVGVERIFPLLSPKIEKIEVKKVAKVRRAKLFFLRGRQGKAARLSERFTTAEEFAVAIPGDDDEVETQDDQEEADVLVEGDQGLGTDKDAKKEEKEKVEDSEEITSGRSGDSAIATPEGNNDDSDKGEKEEEKPKE